MTSKVKIVSLEILEKMHTGSLMSRRKALLACEESLSLSDRANAQPLECHEDYRVETG